MGIKLKFLKNDNIICYAWEERIYPTKSFYCHYLTIVLSNELCVYYNNLAYSHLSLTKYNTDEDIILYEMAGRNSILF